MSVKVILEGNHWRQKEEANTFFLKLTLYIFDCLNKIYELTEHDDIEASCMIQVWMAV